MITVLGTACVAWTTYELMRLARGSRRVASLADSLSRESQSRARRTAPEHGPRFAAWDDRGRPITVEDLGQR